jgi:hypothetical protein
MPYTLPNGKRDYKRQNALVDSKPAARKHRVVGVQVQRKLEKEGRATKGDGLDNGHKVAFSKGGSSDLENIKLQNPSANRSFSRNADSSLKRERSKKGK